MCQCFERVPLKWEVAYLPLVVGQTPYFLKLNSLQPSFTTNNPFVKSSVVSFKMEDPRYTFLCSNLSGLR